MRKYTFDIITNSESKFKNIPTINIEIPGYQSSCIITIEAEKGGTMIHIKNGINFKVREDLKIYQSKSLESTFVELMNEKQSNCIVGVIYRHPTMDTSQFTENKLTDLLDKISRKSNKKVYLNGDFNFDLLKISSNTETSNFYDKVTCNLFLPLTTTNKNEGKKKYTY